MKEFASEIIVPEGSQDSDFVRARWRDGCEHEISSLTVLQWRAREAAIKQSKGKHPPLWEEAGWFVREKRDRHTLLWVGSQKEKGRQRCQIRADKCKSYEVALNVMIGVARALADGESDLYAVRDED